MRTVWMLGNAFLLMALLFATVPAAVAEEPETLVYKQHQTRGLLDRMLQGPLSEVEEVVFAFHGPAGWHWYETFGYICDNPKGKKHARGPGMLARLKLRTGEMTPILEDRGGSMRDPCVHWDGRRILFSYRPGGW